jgi:hypothetical protein
MQNENVNRPNAIIWLVWMGIDTAKNLTVGGPGLDTLKGRRLRASKYCLEISIHGEFACAICLVMKRIASKPRGPPEWVLVNANRSNSCHQDTGECRSC